jgi:hypothetical protein
MVLLHPVIVLLALLSYGNCQSIDELGEADFIGYVVISDKIFGAHIHINSTHMSLSKTSTTTFIG